LAIQCKNDGAKELEELGELQELLDKVSITMEGDEKQWELTSSSLSQQALYKLLSTLVRLEMQNTSKD
jgi:hypothetical protein